MRPLGALGPAEKRESYPVIFIFITAIRVVTRVVEGVRERNFPSGSILIHVTNVFVLQSKEIPLPPSEHL